MTEVDKIQKAEWRLQGACTDCGGIKTVTSIKYPNGTYATGVPFCSKCSWPQLASQTIGRGLRGGLKKGVMTYFGAGTGVGKSTYVHR